MNTKFIGAAAVAIVLVAVAWKISSDRAPQTDVARSELYPGLLERLNDIERIEIRSAEKQTSLERTGADWTVANRDHYPASFANVKRAILQIADLRLVEPKTSQPASYARIGVADIEAEDADGTFIEMYAAGDTRIVGLIVGHSRDAGRVEQHYVRRAGEAQSWLVDGALELSADPITWLDAKIADIDADRVSRVTVTPAEGPAVVIAKDSPSDNFFELQNIPAGFASKSKAIVSSLGALLLDLRFNDVAAATRVEGLTPRRSAELQTFDGLIARIDAFDVDGETFARFDFDYDASLVVPAATTRDAENGEAGGAEPADTDAAGGEAANTAAASTETAGTDAANTEAASPDMAETRTGDAETATAPAGDEPSTADANEGSDAATAASPSDDAPAPDAAGEPPKETVQQEVERLAQRTAGWVYRLPDYKLRMLDKNLDDLIKEEEKEDKAAE